MPDWLAFVLFGFVLAWLASVEVRFWRAYRAIVVIDAIIRAVSRYARERGE